MHGEQAVIDAEQVSAVLFGDGDFRALSGDMIATLAASAPSHEVQLGSQILDVIVEAKLASSKREARQFLSEGAIALNGEVVSEGRTLTKQDFNNGIALLKRGRRNVSVLLLS